MIKHEYTSMHPALYIQVSSIQLGRNEIEWNETLYFLP